MQKLSHKGKQHNYTEIKKSWNGITEDLVRTPYFYLNNDHS